jgi:hypothetical protein
MASTALIRLDDSLPTEKSQVSEWDHLQNSFATVNKTIR